MTNKKIKTQATASRILWAHSGNGKPRLQSNAYLLQTTKPTAHAKSAKNSLTTPRQNPKAADNNINPNKAQSTAFMH
jgi:hypothetical protein